MTDSLNSLLIFGSELAIVLLAVMLFFFYRMVQKQRLIRTQIKILIDILRKNEPVRLQDRKDQLRKIIPLSNDELDKSIAGMLKQEKSLYSKIIENFLVHDGSRLPELQQPIEALIKSCWIPHKAITAAPAADAGEDDEIAGTPAIADDRMQVDAAREKDGPEYGRSVMVNDATDRSADMEKELYNARVENKRLIKLNDELTQEKQELTKELESVTKEYIAAYNQLKK